MTVPRLLEDLALSFGTDWPFGGQIWFGAGLKVFIGIENRGGYRVLAVAEGPPSQLADKRGETLPTGVSHAGTCPLEPWVRTHQDGLS